MEEPKIPLDQLVIALINAVKGLADAFNGLIVGIFELIHIDVDPRIVNAVTLLLIVFTLVKIAKKLPLIIVLVLTFLGVIQIAGFF